MAGDERLCNIYKWSKLARSKTLGTTALKQDKIMEKLLQ